MCGGNTNQPLRERQSVDHPVGFYAAREKANELMAHDYSHLYGLPASGLRFFTVHGPWGRPKAPSAAPPPERATERVAVLMTPTEKAAYADRVHSLGLSLGQFFREACAANAGQNTRFLAEAETLEAALKQLELSTRGTEQAMDVALAEVRAALGAQL